MSDDVTTYLKYASLQMAAEALWDRQDPEGVLGQLKYGNNRSSRFTPVQAQQFIDEGWTVAEHISNTGTGFSGTLFRNTQTGEQALSFRSTEFIDDAARDNQATNKLEISEKGWAFGQIDDMKSWVDSLYASGKIATTEPLTVTGYSLGGHLATAFNLLYPSAVASTYTFNGAGVGALKNGTSLSTVISDFHRMRENESGAEIVFDDTQVQDRYIELRIRYAGGTKPTIEDIASVRLLEAGSATAFAESEILVKALERVRSVMQEAERVATLADPGSNPLNVDGVNIAATDLDYQLAVLFASKNTEAQYADVAQGGWTAYAGRHLAGAPWSNFHELYGANAPSAVSNSQLHYGEGVPIFIEDQPLFRGNVLLSALGASAWNAEAKLLVNNFGSNDFGDTHSLVLIVDSLSVQSTLVQLDPGITQATLNAIFAAASCKKAESTISAQGQAEGDVLENVVKSLAAMFDIDIEPMAAKLDGGTWANADDRAAFHRNLDAISKRVAELEIEGESVIRTSSADLKAAARNDFGAVLALMNLAPFWIAGKDAASKGELETVWEFVHGEDFLAWQEGKSAATPTTFTDEWIEDRARLLSALMIQGKQNSSSGLVYDISVPADRAYEFKYIGGDIPQGQTQPIMQTLFAKSREGVVLPDQRISFGDDGENVLEGTDNKPGDHLYGGAGADTLSGGKGDDYLQGDTGDDILEGGEGYDTLLGGAGADTYRFAGTWGTDTVIDADGDGTIEIDSVVLEGGMKVADGVWRNEEQGILYTLSDAGATQMLVIQSDASPNKILVKGWRDGDLGLVMDDEEESDESLRIFIGDQRAPRIGVEIDLQVTPDQTAYNTFKWSATHWAADGTLEGGVVEEGFSDAIRGSSGDDRISGLAGNDALQGGDGDDDIDGGVGDDLIGGGSGSDTIRGGDGADYINSSANLTVGARWRLDDIWLPPAGKEVKTQGAHWGIYLDTQADGDPVSIWSGSGSPAGTDGDYVDGGSGDDSVIASGGADHVQGGAGSDGIDGMGGNDVLEGGDGKDDIRADGIVEVGFINSVEARYHGADLVDGGAGDDTLTGGGMDDVIYGGADHDSMWGDDSGKTSDADYLSLAHHGSDLMDGEDGDDYLEGGGKDDTLYGGAGNDNMWGDTSAGNVLSPADNLLIWGNDLLEGESGDDDLIGGGKDDLLYGGAGNDSLWGDQDDAALSGEFNGNDYLDGGEGSDYLVGGGKDDLLHGGAGNDTLLGDDELINVAAEFHGEDYLDGGEGDDYLEGGGGDDVLLGGDGNDLLDGGEGADYLFGGAGNDSYVVDDEGDVVVEADDPEGASGGSVDSVESFFSYTLSANLDNLTLKGSASIDGSGNWLDNSLFGNAGSNTLTGGAGNDYLAGGRGNDVYVFRRGDGRDSIGNLDLMGDGATDTLRFGDGIEESDVLGFRVGDSVIFQIKGSTDQIEVLDYYGARAFDDTSISDRKIDVIEFANGVTWDQAMLESVADRSATNKAPVVNHDVPTLQARSGSLFTYTVPADSITDSDAWDSVNYSITMQDGSPVPAWLSFDAATRKLSGVPDPASVGTLRFWLWGTDTYGAAAATLVELNVRAPNRAPAMSTALPDQEARQGSAFSYTLPAGAFADPDAGDVLTYGATLADGSALPSWLTFDPSSRSFSGTPSAVGTTSVRISASDAEGGEVADVFDIVVASSTILGTSGDDVLTGGTGNDFLWGFEGNDTLNGYAGSDTLNGGAGDDKLYGSSGNDILNGGAGNDTLVGGAGVDVVQFDRGDGIDTIEVMASTGALEGEDVIRLGAGFTPDDMVLIGEWYTPYTWLASKSGTERIAIGGLNSGSATSVGRVEFVDGTQWTAALMLDMIQITTNNDDHFVGTGGSDSILGYAGNDTITSLGGNDYIEGGTGSNTIDAGAGDDTVISNGRDVVDLGSGNDVLNFGSGYSYDGSVTLRTGAGDDQVYLDRQVVAQVSLGDGVDTFSGDAERLSLQFGAGIDMSSMSWETLRGAAGNVQLILHYGTLGDKIILDADVVTFASGWNNAVSVLLPGMAIRLAEDAVPASPRALPVAPIQGSDGADSLYGVTYWYWGKHFGLPDTFIGGKGNDVLDGNLGADTYIFNPGDGQDVVRDEDGANTVRFGPGIALDDLHRHIGFEAEPQFSIGYGSVGDSITFNRFHLDTTFLFADGQKLSVSDVLNRVTTYDVRRPDPWTVEVSGGSYTLQAGERDVHLLGADVVRGAPGQLVGNEEDNLLDAALATSWYSVAEFGPRGVDLDGGTGADTMIGSDGSDTFHVDNIGDNVLDEGDEYGRGDTVVSSVDWTLGANLEHLELVGRDRISGTGNELNNTIDGRGNTVANVLRGSAGNDTYFIGTGDVVIEAADEGWEDSVHSLESTVLGANVEKLVLEGSANVAGTGNALRNSLVGNSGNNVLDGGADADSLSGGGGDDTYVVDADDFISEYKDEGVDTVLAAFSFVLAEDFENLSLLGGAAINGTGNSSNNVVIGNSGRNVLRGAAGDDTLDGAAGNDIMLGGTGNDVFIVDATGDVAIENFDEGKDTVFSSVTHTLAANVENLRINAIGAINATGNTLDNTLYAAAGNNVLNGLGGIDTASYLYAGSAVTASLASTSTQATGGSGSDTLQNIENLTGSSFNDTLTGSTAANVLDGGLGNDALAGGAGNDTYRMGRGQGSDTIAENDATAGNTDVAQFGADIATDQLWFQQVGNNLEVSVIGTTDKFTLGNWYLGSQYHVEQFRTSDGHLLTDSAVQNLVQAMASFSPPAAGQTTLPPNYQSSLNTVIAANWH